MDQWVSSIATAIDRQDGASLSSCFALLSPSEGKWLPIPQFIANGQTSQLLRVAGNRLDGPWADACVEYAGCMDALTRKEYAAAYKGLAAAFMKLLVILRDETAWLLPLVFQSTYDMRILAEVSDCAAPSEGQQHASLRDCSEKLQKGFASCVTDRLPISNPNSKQRGVVFMTVSAFKVYFKIGNYRSCKSMITPLERSLGSQPSVIESGHVPRSDLVTYKFYKGRLCVYEDKYGEAAAELEWALNHCHAKAVHNKRRVLSYLIPIHLCHGKLPSEALLRQFKFNEFTDLVKAVKSGDLGSYNQCLVTFLDVFIKQGTYLVLEKAKTLVYRNLVKKVHRLTSELKAKAAGEEGGSAAATTVKLGDVEAALKVCGEPLSPDEVECTVANLIYNGHVKGYISHKQRVLVLSKTNPFPLASFAP
mmetsp:Transcript_52939/g.106112  ORF Transcript_52939/g.106112 Transcript_52939/m.106112 type:complete len:421 (-) Transcript_52939:279-1541(-)